MWRRLDLVGPSFSNWLRLLWSGANNIAKLHSTDELLAHCATTEHLKATRRRPIPEEYIDPRHQIGFDDRSAFDRAKDLRPYEAKVRCLLEAPLKNQGVGAPEAFVEAMTALGSAAEKFILLMAEDGEIDQGMVNAVLASGHTTADNIGFLFIIFFVAQDFLEDGIDGQYCSEIVYNQGYESYNLREYMGSKAAFIKVASGLGRILCMEK